MQRFLVFDTNILSMFAELGQLELLLTLFRRWRLCVTLAVHDELQAGIKHGHNYLGQIISHLEKTEPRIEIVIVREDESAILPTLPSRFARGEADSIVVCQMRGWVFVSHDKKAVNYCKRNGIAVLTLSNILAALWQSNLVNKTFVAELIQQFEASGRIIRDKDTILQQQEP